MNIKLRNVFTTKDIRVIDRSTVLAFRVARFESIKTAAYLPNKAVVNSVIYANIIVSNYFRRA